MTPSIATRTLLEAVSGHYVLDIRVLGLIRTSQGYYFQSRGLRLMAPKRYILFGKLMVIRWSGALTFEIFPKQLHFQQELDRHGGSWARGTFADADHRLAQVAQEGSGDLTPNIGGRAKGTGGCRFRYRTKLGKKFSGNGLYKSGSSNFKKKNSYQKQPKIIFLTY